MSSGKISLKQDNITWTATNEGTVIVLDLRSSEYLSINTSAAGLWELLSEGRPVESLVDRLMNDYNLDRVVAEADVCAFIDDLRSRDLIYDQA